MIGSIGSSAFEFSSLSFLLFFSLVLSQERGRKLHSHKPKARRKKCSKSSQGRVALPRPFPLQRQTILSISAEYCEKRLRVVFQTPPNKRSEAEVRGAIQVIEYLSSFYRGLPPETRRMMAAAMGITAVQTGQVLHSHNAPPQALYIVVRGHAMGGGNGLL